MVRSKPGAEDGKDAREDPGVEKPGTKWGRTPVRPWPGKGIATTAFAAES